MDVLLAATFVLVSWQYGEVFSEEYFITRFIQGLRYNMISSAGKLFTINSSSRVMCTTLCIEVVNCMSVVYDAGHGNCTFYQDILQNSTHNLPSNIQYLVNKGRYCTWRGFQYSQTYDICYLLDHSSIAYTQTKQFCKSRDSALIRIDSPEKQRFIESVIQKDKIRKFVYISGDKLSGQWYFTDGPAISTFYWATNQPSDYFDKHCLMVSGSLWEKRWFNHHCYQYGETGRICEMDIKSLIH